MQQRRITDRLTIPQCSGSSTNSRREGAAWCSNLTAIWRTKVSTICCRLVMCSGVSEEALTLYLLTWIIWWALNKASKGQMEFNSVFKGLIKMKVWCWLVNENKTNYLRKFYVCCVWPCFNKHLAIFLVKITRNSSEIRNKYLYITCLKCCYFTSLLSYQPITERYFIMNWMQCIAVLVPCS